MSIATRTVTMAEMEKLVKKARYVYMWVDPEKYCRPFVRADRATFVSNICASPEKFEYIFHIDPDFNDTIYVDKVTRVEKQPVGGTEDAPSTEPVPR